MANLRLITPLLLTACSIENPIFGLDPTTSTTSTTSTTGTPTTGHGESTDRPATTTAPPTEDSTTTAITATATSDPSLTTQGPGTGPVETTGIIPETTGETGLPETTMMAEPDMTTTGDDSSETGVVQQPVALGLAQSGCYGTQPGTSKMNIGWEACETHAKNIAGGFGDLYVDLAAMTAMNVPTRWSSVLLFGIPPNIQSDAASITAVHLSISVGGEGQNIFEPPDALEGQSPGNLYLVDCNILDAQVGQDIAIHYIQPPNNLNLGYEIPNANDPVLLSPDDIVVFTLDAAPIVEFISQSSVLCLALDPTHKNGVVYNSEALPSLELTY